MVSDDLFLGAVPVEIEAVAGAVSEQEIRVGNLVLDVVARQVAALLLGARIAAASSPASLAAADAGSVAITMPSSSVPMVEGAASQMAAAAGASARSPDTQTDGRLTGRGDAAEQSPKRRLSRVARRTAPIAVVVVGVALLLTIRGEREAPSPVSATPPAAASVEATPPAAPAAVIAMPPAAPASAPVQTPEAGAPAAPADPLPVAPVPMERPSANTAKGLIARGNLTGAARAIVGGLKDNPKNSDLVGTLQQLYRAAEAEATNARKAADGAGAKDRPEYADANARLQTARNSTRTAGPQNAEAIVREFGAAADAVQDCCRASKDGRTGSPHGR